MSSKKIVFLIFILSIVVFFSKSIFFVAFVNGKPISRLAVVNELEKKGGKQILDSLISRELIIQEAGKQKVVVKKEEIDKKLSEIEKSATKQGQKLDQLLAIQGMSKEDLKNQIQVQLILEKLLANKIKVPIKEIDEFIKKNTLTETEETTQAIKPPTRKEAEEQLRQQKLQKEAQTLVEQLRKQAKISVFVNY